MPTKTGAVSTLGGVLQNAMDRNIRVFPILFKQFSHIQYAFFDVKQLAGAGGGMSLDIKNIPGIDSTLTVDGVSVKWYDYSLFDFSTTIDGAQTPTAVASVVGLTVEDTSGYAVNDTVYITKVGTSDEVDGIVTAIGSGTTMSVLLNQVNGLSTGLATITLDLADGQTIERGFWRRNDNDEITRPSATYNYKECQSYIQHFSRRLEFTKAELNVVYEKEGDAVNAANKKFEYNLGIIFQEINKAIYKGKNIAPGAGATDKVEMLGLESICRENGAVVSLAASTDKVADLFAQIDLAYQSGAVIGNEPMLLLVNDSFLSALSLQNADLVRYDKYVDELRMEIPTLSTIYGKVDIVRDPMLNKLYRYSTSFVAPRSLMKLVVRENQMYEPKKGITKADQSARLYPVTHNLREKEMYDLELELGMVAGGMTSNPSPYRMITNF